MPMPLDQPRTLIDSPRVGTLTDVPEDQPLTPSARSPYFHHAVTGSATTFKPAASTTSLSSDRAGGSMGPPTRTSSAASQRTPSGLTARSGQPRSASGDVPSGMATPRNQRSGSPATLKERDGDRDREGKDEKRERRERERDREGGERTDRKGGRANQPPPTHRLRNTPHLPHAKDVELAPATLMHWSRAPVYGAMPLHGMRAHSVTLIDSIAWLFGGCDEKGCWKDVFCFNTGVFFRSHLECGHPCFRDRIITRCLMESCEALSVRLSRHWRTRSRSSTLHGIRSSSDKCLCGQAQCHGHLCGLSIH